MIFNEQNINQIINSREEDNIIDLCRYMSFQRFCEIVFNQELVLVSPDSWNDKYERYIYQVLKTEEGKNRVSEFLRQEHHSTERDIENLIKLIITICESAHCLCFSKNIDAEVMWNSYSYNSQAIMIKTTDLELKELTREKAPFYELREVEYDLEEHGLEYLYKLFNQNGSRSSVAYDYHFFTHKRKAFKYEQEVRLIESNPHNNKDTKFIHCSIVPEKLIKGVMVHPLATEDYTDLIKKICEKFNLEFLGKSTIYDFDEIF